MNLTALKSRPAVLGAGLAAVLLTVTACSSSGGGGGASSAASPSMSMSMPAAPPASASAPGSTAATATGITIKDFGFSGELTVKPGEKVTVTNMDSAAHTLTDKATDKFDTGNIAGDGGTGTFTAPTTPGKYPFGCTYHPNMAGTLTVTAN